MDISDQDITQLLQEKHSLYLRLKESTVSFKKVLKNGSLEDLSVIARQRDKLMGAIDALDNRLSLAGYRPTSGCGGDKGSAVQKLIARLVGTLKETFAIHEECLTYAQARSQELKQQILCLQRNSQAVRGYAPPKKALPRFIDAVK